MEKKERKCKRRDEKEDMRRNGKVEVDFCGGSVTGYEILIHQRLEDQSDGGEH